MKGIQRFEVEWYRGGPLGPVVAPQERGQFCRYTDLLWYQRQYWMALIINIIVVIACAVLAALLVHEKAAHSPVETQVGASEKAEHARALEAIQKERDDYKAIALNYKAQIKTLTAKVASHVEQLEALQARGQELDRLNKDAAARMSTQQGVVLEAKRILGVNGDDAR